ncbi:hypothetical protein [Cohnella rhizosphaerae]|uniref:Extracellular solute-binding protein n=1 Tax=Cohnella rhizosphaerae TaxID=1457232 RepID=A0A9X4L000_9BACL|nr:hypothetical protein [Cohnella rhizosphaerae]MDG0814335.1 hypothetical protein [Cohnella rhizosphaerae]
MTKKLLAAASILLGLAPILAGCGSDGKDNADASRPASQQTSNANASSEGPSGAAAKVKVRMSYWNKEDSMKTLLKLIEESCRTLTWSISSSTRPSTTRSSRRSSRPAKGRTSSAD